METDQELQREYVYVLQCADGTFYTGWTTDLEHRVAVHNSGKGAKYTRSRLPVELVYYELYEDRSAAKRREYAIKKLTRAEKEKLVSSMNMKNIIGEATEWDRKASLERRKPRSWCKSISAFANTLGGTLIFGITDDGEMIGVDDPQGDAERISELIKSRMDPIPKFRMRFHRADNGKVLLILDVFKGEDTPYYYVGDGSMEAYVRIGNESVKASQTELRRLVLRGVNTTFDSVVTNYRIEDFAFSKLQARYKKWTGSSFQEKEMISFGLATPEGFLTNAGLLMADDSPILCSRVFCTRWLGLTRSDANFEAYDDAEISGSVLYVLDEAEAFIRRYNRKMWRKTACSREDMPDYVERSYHEALINALAHREYLEAGTEVHIDIYDSRMEIRSPGGMPDGSRIQERNPLTVTSTRRNPVLADVLNRLGYMERKGSGFEKIISGYESQLNYTEEKKPTFYSDQYQFAVTLPNLNYGAETIMKERILKYGNANGVKPRPEELKLDFSTLTLSSMKK